MDLSDIFLQVDGPLVHFTLEAISPISEVIDYENKAPADEISSKVILEV
jgi:hypothetical protein